MNPLDNITPWLDTPVLARAVSTLDDGCPFDETTRYSLAFSITEELEKIGLAVSQLQLAESKWREERHPPDIFQRGLSKLRQERADVEAARLTYKRALRVLRMSQERKELRNRLHDAAIASHNAGYTAAALSIQSECAAAWIETTDTQQGAA